MAPAGRSAAGMLIRRERPGDVDAVREVHRLAFAGAGDAADPVEVRLLGALRSDPGWLARLSLVAEATGGNGAPTVVGHVVSTRGVLRTPDGEVPVLGLGPIGVLPARQGEGIGSALVHAACAAAEALDEPLLALLGEPAFYRRFGFVAAAELEVGAPDPAWGAYFQARPLAAYDRARHRGPFRYAAPFDRL